MRCPPGRLAERLEPASAGGEHVQGAAQQDSGEGCAVERPVVGKRYLSVRPSGVRGELGAGPRGEARVPARPAEPRGAAGAVRAGGVRVRSSVRADGPGSLAFVAVGRVINDFSSFMLRSEGVFMPYVVAFFVLCVYRGNYFPGEKYIINFIS